MNIDHCPLGAIKIIYLWKYKFFGDSEALYFDTALNILGCYGKNNTSDCPLHLAVFTLQFLPEG